MLFLILIIFLIIYLAIIGFSYWKTGSIAKTWFFSSLFILFCLILISVLIIIDIRDMKNKFPISSNLLIVTDSSDVLLGIEISSLEGLVQNKESPKLLDGASLSKIAFLYNNKEFNKIKNSHYKVIFIDISTFQKGLLKKISLGEFNTGFNLLPKISVNYSLSLLKSKDPLQIFLKDFVPATIMGISTVDVIPKELKKPESLKFILFSLIFQQEVSDHGPLFIIENFKADKIQIYPETITFKTVKLIPMSMYEKVYKKINKKLEAVDSN